jgi:hypothetical protein
MDAITHPTFTTAAGAALYPLNECSECGREVSPESAVYDHDACFGSSRYLMPFCSKHCLKRHSSGLSNKTEAQQ